MNNSFKEDMEIIKNKDINKILQLDKILKRIKNSICRGEVNIIGKDNNILSQTHYEYFSIFIDSEKIFIERYNCEKEMGTLDRTNVDATIITKYEVNPESLTLEGELSKDIKINILIVLKEPKNK